MTICDYEADSALPRLAAFAHGLYAQAHGYGCLPAHLTLHGVCVVIGRAAELIAVFDLSVSVHLSGFVWRWFDNF